MTPLRSSLIPARQAVSNAAEIHANLFRFFELYAFFRPASGLRTGIFTATENLPEVTGSAKAGHSGNCKHPSARRFVTIRFAEVGSAKKTDQVTAGQTADTTYVTCPPKKSPLFRIDHPRLNRPKPIPYLAAESALQVVNSPQTLDRHQPDTVHPNVRFAVVQKCTCTQKTIVWPSFSLDNALLQQTSLAVWFFAHANRFTNDWLQTALKRRSCSDES